MKTSLRFFVCVAWLLLLATTTGLAQPGTTMYVNGRHLYSAVGEKVVLRGVNEMFIWSGDRTGVNILPQIAQSGANVVRLVWLSSGSPAELDALIGNCIQNKMIPLVDMHDATGNWGNIQTCINYMKRSDVIAVMNKYKKWVLLNIANEAGDASVTNDQFRTTYIDAVSQLRGVGYTFPLVIDAADWGKQENYIFNSWSAIQQSDPQHSCIFSIHPYWVEDVASQQTRFTNVMNTVVANNIPFMLGEGPEAYGYNCTSPIPYVWMMQQLQTNQVGWLAWSWGTVKNGDCTNIGAYDITSNGQYGNWQGDWGRLIVSDDPNSIKNTSVRPPSILGTLPADTQPPTAPTNLTVSNVTPVGATLSWTASTDNVGVAAYDVYAGATLLTSTANTNVALTSLSCNTAYAFTVKARDAAGNASGASNVANATTGACPAGDVIYTDALNATYQDWSWNCTRNYSATPAIEGSYSLRVDYGGYGGVSFRRNTALATSAGMVLKFWVYSAGTSPLQVYTQSDDSGGNSSVVSFSTQANTWQEITVTMAQLGNPAQIKRINIQEGTGASPTVFFDNIRFDTGSTPPPADTQAPTAPTNLAASGVTTTGLTLAWTAATDNVGVTGYRVFQGSTQIGTSTGTSYSVSGLSCKTAYTFSVKAIDAAGNVSNSSNVVSTTTAACADVVVYNDAINPDWQDWSWSIVANYANTSPVKVGSKSAKVTYSAWGGLSFYKSTALKTTPNTVLKFWVRSSGSNSINVYTNGEDGGSQSSSYVFNTPTNTWQEITVTMAQLGNPAQIKRINFQNNSANGPVVYFDNIRIMSVSGARQAAPPVPDVAASMVVYPNPSDGLLTVNYTAPQAESVQLRFVNAGGTLLHRQDEQAEEGPNMFTVDVRQQPAGLYWLQLVSPSGNRVSKVLLQR